jgi:hypothetical protein
MVYMMNDKGNSMEKVKITIHGKEALATAAHAKVLIKKYQLVLEIMELREAYKADPAPTAAMVDEMQAINRKIIAMNSRIQREGIHCVFQ